MTNDFMSTAMMHNTAEAPDMMDEVDDVVVACAAAKGAASTATASTTRNTAMLIADRTSARCAATDAS